MSARSQGVARRTTGDLLAFALLACGAVIVLTPLAWMISTSLKDPGKIYLYPPQWIPDPVRWETYAHVLTQWPFLTYLRNTFIITTLSIVGSVFSSALVAYSFARLRWRYRDFFFLVCLATMMLPPQVTLVPTFILFVKLGWLDSFLPLTVPAFFGQAFYIFMLRQFFRTLPRSLDEAALIDGCGYLRIFTQIVLPLARPAVLAVAIFTFMAAWNDFMGPLIYLSSEHKRTLALALAFFSSNFFSGIHTHTLMAASLIVMLPCIAIFFVFQRQFISGMVFSGMKG